MNMDDLVSAASHVDKIVPRADGIRGVAPFWHGWAVRDAFLAGIKLRDDQRAACKHTWSFVGEDTGGQVHWCRSCGSVRDSGGEITTPGGTDGGSEKS